jgi:hypothetical protein
MYLWRNSLRAQLFSGSKVGAWGYGAEETDVRPKGPLLRSSLERVRALLGHLHGDLLAGVKIEFPENIGDVFVYSVL